MLAWVTRRKAWNGSRSEGQGRDGRRREPRPRLRRRGGAGARRRDRLDLVEQPGVDRRGRASGSRPAARRSSAPSSTSATATRSPRWAQTTVERFGGVDLLFTNGGGPPAGAGGVVRRCGVAERGRSAALQRHPHGARGGAVDEAARRRRDPDVDLGVGEGADPQPRAVDRAARVGVGAVEDAGARAGAPTRSASTRSFPAASTPIASSSSTRSPARSRGSAPTRRRRKSIGDDPDGPLRRGDGVRPGRRVPPVRRRVLHDRRDRAGRRRR